MYSYLLQCFLEFFGRRPKEGRTRARPSGQRGPPEGGPLWGVVKSALVGLSFGLTGGVLDVADGFVRRTLGLVELAFDLQLLVARYLASRFLDSALCLVGRCLDVLLVHDFSFDLRMVGFALLLPTIGRLVGASESTHQLTACAVSANARTGIPSDARREIVATADRLARLNGSATDKRATKRRRGTAGLPLAGGFYVTNEFLF